MRRIRSIVVAMVLVALAVIGSSCRRGGDAFVVAEATAVAREPRLRPGFGGAVVPPNLGPLNFLVDEEGESFVVRLVGDHGEVLEVSGAGREVRFSPSAWRSFLRAQAGRRLSLQVAVQKASGIWERFMPVSLEVAREPIDRAVVYRYLKPLYNFYSELGIYEHDLETHQVRPVLQNKDFGGGCLNCHTFLNRRPEDFVFHIRGVAGPQPMILVRSNEIARIDRTAGYVSWHPSGRLLAFSANKLSLFFHTLGETRDVFDAESNLGLYWVSSNVVETPAVIARSERLETWPSWSPDGRYLYYCSAPKLRRERFRQVRYDLMRVRFEIDQNRWGEPELLVSSEKTGLSAAQPRVSPDGRWLLFCLAKYGHFPVYQPSSDLYLMDLQAEGNPFRCLEVNSEVSDSWHAWSSNGRWVVFSSKRGNGLLARPHFSHVDEVGRFAKPFVLPQTDPTFYDSCIETFNVPEFIVAPVQVSAAQLASGIVRPRTVLTPGGDRGMAHREEQNAPQRESEEASPEAEAGGAGRAGESGPR